MLALRAEILTVIPTLKYIVVYIHVAKTDCEVKTPILTLANKHRVAVVKTNTPKCLLRVLVAILVVELNIEACKWHTVCGLQLTE